MARSEGENNRCHIRDWESVLGKRPRAAHPARTASIFLMASSQSELPLDGVPPPSAAEKAADATRALRIVSVGAKPLGREQKRFNKLLARIENLRKDIAARTRAMDAGLAEYVRRIHPLELRLHEARRKMVTELGKIWRDPKSAGFRLGKKQRAALRDVLLHQFDCLQQFPPGDDDADLCRLNDELIAAAEAEMNAANGKGGAGDDDAPGGGGPKGGPDLSKFHPGMSEEEMVAEVRRQFLEMNGLTEEDVKALDEEIGQAPPPPPRARKPTAAQLRKAQREAEMAEARKRGLATIYKQLAKILHPDLERDAERRAEKERLMQELTAAYKAGDLHTLLRLELEYIHREQGNLERLGEEKLAVYCEVLAEQVRELEAEYEEIGYAPRYQAMANHLRFGGLPRWHEVEAVLGEQFFQLERSREDIVGPEKQATLKEMLEFFQREQKRRRVFFDLDF